MTKEMTTADAALFRAYVTEEEAVQTDVLRMLEAMQDLLVAQDVPGLEAHLVERQGVVQRLEAMASKRARMIGHLLKASGAASVDEIVTRLPENARDGLEAAWRGLQDLARRVRSRSMRNRMLARQGIAFNRDLVRALFGVDARGATYASDGSTSEPAEMILNRSV